MYLYDGLNPTLRVDLNESSLMQLNNVLLTYSSVWHKGAVLVLCYLQFILESYLTSLNPTYHLLCATLMILNLMYPLVPRTIVERRRP